MNDPSFGVPPTLLPHVHLLSTYQYPTLHLVSIDTVVEYLLSAQRITRSLAAVSWTYLDAPSDGSVLLVWQPLAQLGTNFASDGYVWADPEQAFNSEVRGYTVEMYIHRSGFRPGSESLATHCRRRYRLTAKSADSDGPPPDPSLWIVHYSQAEPQHRIPANRIQVPREVQATLSARRYLHSQGQLIQKQFMLHDRDNWPTVNLPGGQTAASYALQTSQYPGNTLAQMSRPQQQPYFPPQQQAAMSGAIGPPPAKRPRQTPPSHAAGSNSAIAAATAAAATHETTIDDEEDTSRGDMLDHLTPREISTMRYAQHHEWMEEVLSSPYAINQILPVDLGLGLKGSLESLTEGFFVAPTIANGKGSRDPSRIGRMEKGKAVEFTRRATDKIVELNAEMEKMKLKHAKRMEKLNRGKAVIEGEKRLRAAAVDPSSTGTEIWRLEGRADEASDVGDGVIVAPAEKTREKVHDIVEHVESSIGQQVYTTQTVVCIHKGGLEEKTSQSAENLNQSNFATNGATNSNIADTEMDLGNSAAGLLDQYRTSATSTPGNYLSTPQPPPSQGQASSQAATPAPQTASSAHTPTPIPNTQQAEPQQPATQTIQVANVDMDVDMTGVPTSMDTDTDTNDWVIVPKTDEEAAHQQDMPSSTLPPPLQAPPENTPLQAQNSTPAPIATADVESSTITTAPTMIEETNNTNVDALSATDFADFANLNEAGDELGGFENETEPLTALDTSHEQLQDLGVGVGGASADMQDLDDGGNEAFGALSGVNAELQPLDDGGNETFAQLNANDNEAFGGEQGYASEMLDQSGGGATAAAAGNIEAEGGEGGHSGL